MIDSPLQCSPCFNCQRRRSDLSRGSGLIVHHYTDRSGLEKILAGGSIEPRSKSHPLDPYGLPRAVWFSAAETWEPACSATIRLGPEGALPENVVPGHPFEAARISVYAEDTRPWRSALFSRLTHWSSMLRLYCTGTDLGSDPGDWRVSLDPVPARKWVAVEIWDGEKWSPMELSDNDSAPAAANGESAGADKAADEQVA